VEASPRQLLWKQLEEDARRKAGLLEPRPQESPEARESRARLQEADAAGRAALREQAGQDEEAFLAEWEGRWRREEAVAGGDLEGSDHQSINGTDVPPWHGVALRQREGREAVPEEEGGRSAVREMLHTIQAARGIDVGGRLSHEQGFGEAPPAVPVSPPPGSPVGSPANGVVPV